MNYPTRVDPSERDQTLFSAFEFAEMIALGAFQDVRAELVGGRIERMAPAYGGHSQSNGDLVMRVGQAYAGKAVIGTDLAVLVDEYTVRGVDIAVSLKDFRTREPTPGSDLLLVVEIADTTLARDLGEKAEQFARCGIPHYWVVDLNARVVHVMGAPSADGYAERMVVRFGEPLPVPGTDQTIVIW